MPILFYQYSVFGNPFASTYSAIDKAWGSVSQILNNISFYINLNQQWLVVHLIALGLLLLLVAFKRLGVVSFLKLLAFPLVNYLKC